jgi:hypothetical protein
MNLKTLFKKSRAVDQENISRAQRFGRSAYRLGSFGLAIILWFYFSLIISSNPVSPYQFEKIEKAINLLEEKGFASESALLRRVTLFRNTDNWLNSLAEKENAFAATNCPFGMITIYPDFYNKTKDDTERAMILLHEARHLQGSNEPDAYTYVWQNRQKLGWTILPYGTTEVYVTVEQQTRDHAPQLFTCPARLWDDCTERLNPNPHPVSIASAK